ncbi:CheA signal transduction histidine kinase [Geoalkalibacter ferrihydriticus]|uniref:Chemotaxis protein CheA n=2 Tax=Geoalkalibacter ferrihydriticus TaxID=392333 RepID=A0A0C2HRQ6_9BACT|nr:chemotaxis protein CheA [Geoalkalibacter ferrihydriticus]KIH75457.1 chemotaxis protein CheA [Geoalkalibacter ferrihydriticus DSM 17813]SDM94312.1 CheA signal transduction histidine kinase [Geoalkalibacter ferrihydriticus]
MSERPNEAFREEAYELLAELETSLLELEDNPRNMDVIGRVFRAMHTIKGSGAMFGFDEISSFTHEIETVFDLVRNGDIAVTKEMVDLCLLARDQIKTMLDAADGGPQVDRAQTADLVTAFRAFLPQIPEAAARPTPEGVVSGATEQADTRTWRIRFRPAPDIFANGTNPLSLLRELCELGEGRVVAQTDHIPPIEDLNPEACYLYWDVILSTSADRNAIADVFIFVEDDSEVKITAIDEDGCLDDGDSRKLLGEILVERGEIQAADLERVLATRKRLGEMLVEDGLVKPGAIASALAEQQVLDKQRQTRPPADAASSLRVPAERLDKLVDLVGELVTVQSRLSQTAAGREDTILTAVAEEVERLVEELRDLTLNIRMLPIGTTFSKFKRLVRDLSHELGKEIELETSGADTELDKTVIERLNDPLVHIIRNSIDHGIEMPDLRQVAGKRRQGTIHLSAIHSGDSVVIEIRDDGKGLDRDAIRAKAIDKGLLDEQDEPSDNELFQLIFGAGFSTAQNVTNVSGRGVGMDVVRRAIEALRGSIDIRSEKGKGTTIRVRIPLTLAIIESLLVAIGKERFVLPLSLVEECIELTAQDVAAAHGRNLVRVRDQLVPYLPLRRWFAMDAARPDIEQVVITTLEGRRVGFVVDQVIGEHQTVIKSLGRMYRDVQGISGATILGDGSVALILDVPQLVHGAELEERLATGQK